MHKYIFGIRPVYNQNDFSTELQLDFFIDDYPSTEKGLEDLNLMIDMTKNKINKSTEKEAIKAYKFERLANELKMIKYMKGANNLSIHVINFEYELEREDLRNMVELANTIPDIKQQLLDSRINI